MNGAPGSQLVVSGDLADWTVTPMEEVLGTASELVPKVVVGADRRGHGVDRAGRPHRPPGTLTAVGTPVRQD